MSKKSKPERRDPITKDAVLEHLAAHPGDTKRDLAKVFKLKGSERQALKQILSELKDEGVIERGRRKSYVAAGALPEVAVLEIFGEDPDGDLLGRPVEWKRDEPPPSVLIVPGKDEPSRPLGRGERVLARIARSKEGLAPYEGRVIKRLGASAHRVLGVLARHNGRAAIEPIDRKTRHSLMLEDRDLNGAREGELVLAEPLAGRLWGEPRARVIERLGSMNEPKAVSLIAIHEHGIPTDFPREAVQEAERAKPVTSLAARTDLRSTPLVTIDPEDARDHDDAVWAGPDTDPSNRGGHIVIVAIADVAHYVTNGSALDREAEKRGNSVYFPDRVVPMLPEELSADLCSLRENEDRPCLAVRMIFDARGVKRRHEFVRGIMRSAARLTYQQAQAAFDGRADQKTAALQDRVMRPLWAAYRTLSLTRDERSPLDLDLPERRVIMGVDGKIESIAFRERLDSMRLIEELMIMANVAAAETLEHARMPLIYRAHEEPSKEKLLAFSDYLRTIGIPFAKGQVMKPAVFNRILERARGTPHREVINDVVLRTQAQAVYDTNNVGHFGLNLARYAHFTSPIRRYADLVVHRALIRARHLGDDGLSDAQVARLKGVADHISMTERRAMAAERDSVDRYVAAYMQDRVGAVFRGRITGVTRFGLFLRLADTGAEGLLPMRSLGFDFFRHDEKRHALVGERTKKMYRMGDTLTVRLAEAAPLTGGLRFELAEDENSAAPTRRNASRPRNARRR